MKIGQRIKNRRLELGLTVDEVATKIGKNRATVYRYESNDIEDLPISILEPLSKALQTTPGYLMGWEDINNLLKERRKEKGLTMKEVASAVGVSEGTVSRWESGNIANMGRDKIYALSKVLGISPAEIMGIDDGTSINNSPLCVFKYDYDPVDENAIRNDDIIKALYEHYLSADEDAILQSLTDMGVDLISVRKGENIYKKLSKEQRIAAQNFIFKNLSGEKEIKILQKYLHLNSEGELFLSEFLDFLLSNNTFVQDISKE